MPAGRYNLPIEKGATFRLPIIYRDIASDPIKFDNMVGVLTLFDVNGAVVLKKTSPDGVTLSAEGSIMLELTAVETGALPDEGGTYRFELINGTFVDRVLKGTWSLE
jgi:hypothetical protein